MCVSCSWAKPADYHAFEFCENGAKATLWELTSRRCTPDFFAKHTVSELREWNDYDLEQQGRLTHPMRYDSATDHYVPCEWEEAFQAIGSRLKSLDPKSVVFYASGRAKVGDGLPEVGANLHPARPGIKVLDSRVVAGEGGLLVGRASGIGRLDDVRHHVDKHPGP